MASALALPFAETIFPSFSQALPHHVGLNANVITPEKACRGQRPPVISLTPLLLITSLQFIFIALSIADTILQIYYVFICLSSPSSLH